MRLKKYTPDTIRKQKRGTPFVRMYLRGLISFSAQATEMIGLEKGDKIDFCRDEDRPYDWHVHVTKGDGFRVWQNERSKQLEWSFNGICYSSIIPVGEYIIKEDVDFYDIRDNRGYILTYNGIPIGKNHLVFDNTKSYAQKDFESRIKECLIIE